MTVKDRPRFVRLLLAAIVSLWFCPVLHAESDVATITGRYRVQGDVVEDKDLSGIAMISHTYGLLGADEGTSVQFFHLDRDQRTIRILRTVQLLEGKTEIDTEGIAVDGMNCYVVGSHGLARIRGEFESTRMNLLQLRLVPPSTDAPAGSINTIRGDLVSVLDRDPVLAHYFKKPLQHDGLNIEGLAARDSQLFVGFRGPSINQRALVLQIDTDAVFRGASGATQKLHQLDLGPGYGIRDIVSVDDDFLIIAGNSGVSPTKLYPTSRNYEKGRPFWIASWDVTSNQVCRLARLPDPPGKAEALMVLNQTETDYEILVLFDGAKDGKPTTYRVPKCLQKGT